MVHEEDLVREAEGRSSRHAAPQTRRSHAAADPPTRTSAAGRSASRRHRRRNIRDDPLTARQLANEAIGSSAPPANEVPVIERRRSSKRYSSDVDRERRRQQRRAARHEAERQARRAARRDARRASHRESMRERPQDKNVSNRSPAELTRRTSRRSRDSGDYVDAPSAPAPKMPTRSRQIPSQSTKTDPDAFTKPSRAARRAVPGGRSIETVPASTQHVATTKRDPLAPAPRMPAGGPNSRGTFFFGTGALDRLISRTLNAQETAKKTPDTPDVGVERAKALGDSSIAGTRAPSELPVPSPVPDRKAVNAVAVAEAKARAAEEAAERAAKARSDKAEKALAAARAKEEALAARELAKEHMRIANERRAEEALRAKEEKKQLQIQLAEEKRNARELAAQQKTALQERRAEEKAEQRAAEQRKREEAETARIAEAQEAQRNKELREIDRRQRRLTTLTPFRRRSNATEINLTPEHRHQLLRTLVMMVMNQEAHELAQPRGIEMYGFPFEVGAAVTKERTMLQLFSRRKGGAGMPVPELPQAQEPLILRQMFHVHLLTFPGLNNAPLQFWRTRIQRFFGMIAECDFSSSRERSEMVLIHLFSLVFTMYFGLYFARGIGVRAAGELRGPGLGDPGTEEWGVGKQWGAGTVKRGLDRPYVLTDGDLDLIDALFTDNDRKLWELAGQEAARPDDAWNAFKETLIEKETGLEEMVSWLSVSNVRNLPVELQATEEWVRNHVARAARWLLVESPSADALFYFVKTAHSLFPYWPARQILHTANAASMVQMLLSLFLAQPTGSKSLLQRIIGAGISKGATAIQKDYIEPLRSEISEGAMIAKIEAYVRHKHVAESRRIDAESQRTGNDILTTILLSPSEPRLDSGTHAYVLDMQRCFAASPYRAKPDLAYPSSTPAGSGQRPIPSWGATGQDVVKARKFALLKLLLRECLKKRDREQFARLLNSNVFIAVIKDAFSNVFYKGFREIANVADLSGRLQDVQKLLDDMIRLRSSGNNSVEAWIELANKHHEFVYFFLHECAPIAAPLLEWLQSGLDYLSLSTTDPMNPADARAERIEVNLDEMLEDERLSNQDVEEILDELDHLVEWSRWSKIRRELVRRRETLFSCTPTISGLSYDVIPESLRKGVKDIDALLAVLMKADGVQPDDGLCDDIRGSERSVVPWAFFDSVDPLGQGLHAEPASDCHRTTPVGTIAPPALSATRKLVPLFRELLISKLPDWLDSRVSGEAQYTSEPLIKMPTSSSRLNPKRFLQKRTN